MRLTVVERGHRLKERILLGIIRLFTGHPPADMLRLVLYRRERFGGPAGAWAQAVLRGPSDWTVGERELLAAYTARVNGCRFCVGAHGAVASEATGDPRLVKAVLDDLPNAPISAGLRAMLGFIEKLTLRPDLIGPGDLKPLRAAGLSEEAIEDGIHVCALFNMIGRIADALDFEVLDREGFDRGAARLLARGYG